MLVLQMRTRDLLLRYCGKTDSILADSFGMPRLAQECRWIQKKIIGNAIEKKPNLQTEEEVNRKTGIIIYGSPFIAKKDP